MGLPKTKFVFLPFQIADTNKLGVRNGPHTQFFPPKEQV